MRLRFQRYFSCHLGDLNSEPTESAVKDFCEIYSCKNLSFQNSVTVETGLADFHKMTLTVMNIVTYRNYKHFSNEAFMPEVKNSIIQMTSENNDLEFDRFKTALDEAISKICSHKKAVCSSKSSAFYK